MTSREDMSREGVAASTESLPRPKTSNPSTSTGHQVEKVVALYDFDAENDDELSFKKGSVIVVVKKQHEGWWVGNCDGSTGVFPSNYVEPMNKTEGVKPVVVKRNSKTVSSPTPSMNSDSSGRASERLVNLSSSTERLAINNDDDDDAPPQQQQMGFSYLPRMEPGASLSSILRTNTKRPAQPKGTEDELVRMAAGNESTKQCGDCGCTDFTANVFKPKSCNNCFHIH